MNEFGRWATILVLVLITCVPAASSCLAGEGQERGPVRINTEYRLPAQAEAAIRPMPDAADLRSMRPTVARTSSAGPAVSLDRRVPAAQVTDKEGFSLVGLLGVVGELRHAFSRKDREQPQAEGVARVVRTLRDSVFGKRPTILSESGQVSENEPFLVGLSFTH